eukprot:2993021-Prymnesium_polylepis.5
MRLCRHLLDERHMCRHHIRCQGREHQLRAAADDSVQVRPEFHLANGYVGSKWLLARLDMQQLLMEVAVQAGRVHLHSKHG